MKNKLNEVRCNGCGKLLAKNKSIFGIEIKCPRCGKLNNVLNGMIQQVIITDNQGRILFINKAVEEVTGYVMHEVVGKKPSELWGGNMSKKFYKDMWDEIVKDKKSIKLNIKNKKKTGEFYNTELLISPVLDVTNEIIFFVGVEIVL